MAKIVISGKEMQLAQVVWYNPQKRFGFVRFNPTGERIFFHFNDGRYIISDGEKPVLGDTSFSKLLAEPRIGDWIIFLRTPGKGGRPKASPWTFLDDWVVVSDGLSSPANEAWPEDDNINQPLCDFIDPSGSSDPNGRNMRVIRPEDRCPNCGTVMNGNEVVQECPSCGYGTEEFDHRNDDDEPHQVSFTESPGGHGGFE